jgi:uncharacterized protein YjdB
VTPANVTLNVLQTQQLVATGTFSDGSTLDITTQARWSSSAKKTVSVNRTGGFIRARKKGSATITATASGLTDSITVTVN